MSKFLPKDFDLEGFIHGGSSKLLLHEAETCLECKKVYLSLYPIRNCKEHEGMEAI